MRSRGISSEAPQRRWSSGRRHRGAHHRRCRGGVHVRQGPRRTYTSPLGPAAVRRRRDGSWPRRIAAESVEADFRLRAARPCVVGRVVARRQGHRHGIREIPARRSVNGAHAVSRECRRLPFVPRPFVQRRSRGFRSARDGDALDDGDALRRVERVLVHPVRVCSPRVHRRLSRREIGDRRCAGAFARGGAHRPLRAHAVDRGIPHRDDRGVVRTLRLRSRKAARVRVHRTISRSRARAGAVHRVTGSHRELAPSGRIDSGRHVEALRRWRTSITSHAGLPAGAARAERQHRRAAVARHRRRRAADPRLDGDSVGARREGCSAELHQRSGVANGALAHTRPRCHGTRDNSAVGRRLSDTDDLLGARLVTPRPGMARTHVRCTTRRPHLGDGRVAFCRGSADRCLGSRHRQRRGEERWFGARYCAGR